MILNNIKLIRAIPQWKRPRKSNLRCDRIESVDASQLDRTLDDSRSVIYVLFTKIVEQSENNQHKDFTLPWIFAHDSLWCGTKNDFATHKKTCHADQTANNTKPQTFFFFFFNSPFNLVRAHCAHAIVASVCAVNLCTFWKRSTATVPSSASSASHFACIPSIFSSI